MALALATEAWSRVPASLRRSSLLNGPWKCTRSITAPKWLGPSVASRLRWIFSGRMEISASVWSAGHCAAGSSKVNPPSNVSRPSRPVAASKLASPMKSATNRERGR